MTATKGKDLILPLIAIGLSLLELVNNAFSLLHNVPALIVSFLGLAAGALYFAKHRWFLPLLYVWIIVQFPAITQTIAIAIPNGTRYEVTPWLDAGQGFTYKVGLVLGGGSRRELEVMINLLPFLLLILYRLLRTSSLIGRAVVIKRFRKDNKLGDVFPIEGKIIRSAALGAEKHWLLVELDRTLIHAGISFAHLLVRDKEGEIYKPGKAARVSFLVMVPYAELIGDGANRKEDFTFIDWGLVEVKK